MKRKYIIFNLIIILVTIHLNIGCKKLVEIAPPQDRLIASNVYNNNASASAVLSGIFQSMTGGNTAFNGGLTTNLGFASDEIRNYAIATNFYYNNSFQNTTTAGTIYYWNELYNYIARSNLAIVGLETYSGVSEPIKRQLRGEALFIRAWSHFYLVNLFGAVPLMTTGDYTQDALAPNTPVTEVYDQIVADLIESQSLLSSDYLSSDIQTPSVDRVRPTKWAAMALLARTYLYMADLPNHNTLSQAEDLSNTLLENTAQFQVQPLANTFLKNTKEAIWQLWPLNGGTGSNGYNTYEANVFVPEIQYAIGADGYRNSAFPTTRMMNAFEPGDGRVKSWIRRAKLPQSVDSVAYFAKYKVRFVVGNAQLTEYVTPLRISEQLLIRAESRIRQGKVAEGISDLNLLRARSRSTPTQQIPNPLPTLSTSLSQVDALSAVLQERRVELFAEYGHRWFDLRRFGKLDEVMNLVTPEKGGVWASFKSLLPIPLPEMRRNPNLIQNPGYGN